MTCPQTFVETSKALRVRTCGFVLMTGSLIAALLGVGSEKGCLSGLDLAAKIPSLIVLIIGAFKLCDGRLNLQFEYQLIWSAMYASTSGRLPLVCPGKIQLQS